MLQRCPQRGLGLTRAAAIAIPMPHITPFAQHMLTNQPRQGAAHAGRRKQAAARTSTRRACPRSSMCSHRRVLVDSTADEGLNRSELSTGTTSKSGGGMPAWKAVPPLALPSWGPSDALLPAWASLLGSPSSSGW